MASQPHPPQGRGAWPSVGPSYPGNGSQSFGQGRGRGRDPSSSIASSQQPCPYRTSSPLNLTLHRADRHLIYPPGGKAELERIDPLLIEERKEAQRRARKAGQSASSQTESSESVMETIPGLNISLSTPELRKKRWPSDKVVAEKRAEAWDDASRGGISRPRPQQKQQAPVKGSDATNTGTKRKHGDVNDSGSSDDSSDDDEDSSDSESDSDGAPSEHGISAPADQDHQDQAPQASTSTPAGPPVCRFYLQGRCNFGNQCKQSHSQPATTGGHSSAAAASTSRPRPRPRNPPPNPFEPRNLLHALLKKEIAQHVSTVAQVVRFLVRNNFLKDVELEAGQAEEQRRRRGRVVEIGKTEDTAIMSAPQEDDGKPAPRALYRARSPSLTPLTTLHYPPEPDPLIFLDPLRRDDPKPLTRPQVVALASDVQLRNILRPPSTAFPLGEARPGLERALSTLDSLPSDAHRSAALELILGVSPQTPVHPHQIGTTFVPPSTTPSSSGGRFIGEVELFRLGLRCGPSEQEAIQRLAKRISEVTEGPEFDVEPRGRKWEKEADRRDMLRRLGLDVD
ncbi:hypothetical protein BDZ90DRAFT_246290 [Jaminaea rosea]|uniref:C3H1-type domain-containing protein n=1 Tax=Jaminaea rosea TaxID=1569628 RepID=A0A316UU62_9BASI|nr:hypothetical protein BDZ90DRAFT_246290 [Jaminaea rosea]PWN27443.1 hypothetical protein BDZ90DRAFT_246290 [Jaminaea rosea]